ncbi:hypothetical protein RIF29_14930 [Crotalaria pallida]|uniref:Uncharacterized protein n=1 Tax=Crotalaria pallida TaxID=3830 RepID=A0AAN9IIS8_CROPI
MLSHLLLTGQPSLPLLERPAPPFFNSLATFPLLYLSISTYILIRWLSIWGEGVGEARWKRAQAGALFIGAPDSEKPAQARPPLAQARGTNQLALERQNPRPGATVQISRTSALKWHTSLPPFSFSAPFLSPSPQNRPSTSHHHRSRHQGHPSPWPSSSP